MALLSLINQVVLVNDKKRTASRYMDVDFTGYDKNK